MKTTDFNNEQNIKTKSEITKTLFAIRVSNASGFNLCVIASPVNSSQFRTISHNSRTVERNSAQLRATEFRLETLFAKGCTAVSGRNINHKYLANIWLYLQLILIIDKASPLVTSEQYLWFYFFTRLNWTYLKIIEK